MRVVRLGRFWRTTGEDALNDEFPGSECAAANDISADSDALILVDAADREVGFLNKALCHDGRGVLHRAFSLLIFNDRGELLLQQRAPSKRLWPLYWSNSYAAVILGAERPWRRRSSVACTKNSA